MSTYTIDDGHPGSYDHEAVVSVQSDATVTVACTCGDWTRTGQARFGDDGDTVVLAEWEAHVYRATGRGVPVAQPDPRPTVWYQVEHSGAVVDGLRLAGLDVLGSDAMPWEEDAADATVTVHEDGVLVDDGDYCEVIRDLASWGSVAEYAAAIARIIRREEAPDLVCAADGCTAVVDEDQPWCSDTCRAQDLASVGGVA